MVAESRSGRRRRRALLLLGGLVGALLSVEAGLRLWAHWTLQERGLTWNEEFGWAYLPGIRKRGPYWSAAEPACTNARGWRDAETPLERRPGTRRIVALGDSFTFGVSVDYGERFSELLEDGIAGLDVVNLGINASGTDQQLRVLEVEGVLYRPDVVLLTAFLGNDLADIANELKNSYPKPYYRLEGGRLELVKPRIGLAIVLRNASYVLEMAMQPFDHLQQRTRVASEWRGRDTVPLFIALVRRMDEVARAAGAHFLVALVYARERTDEGRSEREQRVLSGLRAAGVAVLDTFDAFAAPALPGPAPYAPDGHWSREGHRRYAAALRAELERLGWLR